MVWQKVPIQCSADIKVFPIPVNDFVTLANLPFGSTIQVTDMSGKMVFRSATNSEQTTINTAQFVNGIYLVQIENNGSSVNKRLIINK